MKKIMIIMLLFVAIFAGCSEVDLNNVNLSQVSEEDINKVIVCKDPYMRHGTGCCLDQNKNSICDNDEGNVNSNSNDKNTSPESNYTTKGAEMVSEENLNDLQFNFMIEMETFKKNNFEGFTCLTIEENAVEEIKKCKNDKYLCMIYEDAVNEEIICEDTEKKIVCGIMEDAVSEYKECLKDYDSTWADMSDSEIVEDEIMCTEEWKPVCGKVEGKLETFSNECYMNKEDAHFVYEGECKGNEEQNIDKVMIWVVKDDNKSEIDIYSNGKIVDDYEFSTTDIEEIKKKLSEKLSIPYNEIASISKVQYVGEEKEYSEIEDHQIELEIEEKDGKIYLKWDKYEGSDFMYYKVMHSNTNADIKYPQEAAKIVIDDYKENEAEFGWFDDVNYYRITVVLEGDKYIHTNVIKYVPEEYEEDKEENEVINSDETISFDVVIRNNETVYVDGMLYDQKINFEFPYTSEEEMVMKLKEEFALTQEEIEEYFTIEYEYEQEEESHEVISPEEVELEKNECELKGGEFVIDYSSTNTIEGYECKYSGNETSMSS